MDTRGRVGPRLRIASRGKKMKKHEDIMTRILLQFYHVKQARMF